VRALVVVGVDTSERRDAQFPSIVKDARTDRVRRERVGLGRRNTVRDA
jgi:hypothetical protein